MAVRVSTHRDLDVWRVAMDLVVAVYRATRQLPDSEKFGLMSQMRRAVVSIPSNIAEGAARSSSADFVRFLVIARGSLAELETQLELVQKLEMCSIDVGLIEQLSRVRQMLAALIRKLSV